MSLSAFAIIALLNGYEYLFCTRYGTPPKTKSPPGWVTSYPASQRYRTFWFKIGSNLQFVTKGKSIKKSLMLNDTYSFGESTFDAITSS